MPPATLEDTSPAAQLYEKIRVEYRIAFERVKDNHELNDTQRHLVYVILTSAKSLAWSLIHNLKHPSLNISEHIDEGADVREAYIFACYIELSSFKHYMLSDPRLTGVILEDYDWVVKETAKALGVDQDIYFTKPLGADKYSEYPLDLWISQDLNFYQKIFKKDFDSYAYFGKDPNRKPGMIRLSELARKQAQETLLNSLEAYGDL